MIINRWVTLNLEPDTCEKSGHELMKTFTCSTYLSVEFILLINVKIPTIVGILTFIRRINTTSKCFRQNKVGNFY